MPKTYKNPQILIVEEGRNVPLNRRQIEDSGANVILVEKSISMEKSESGKSLRFSQLSLPFSKSRSNLFSRLPLRRASPALERAPFYAFVCLSISLLSWLVGRRGSPFRSASLEGGFSRVKLLRGGKESHGFWMSSSLRGAVLLSGLGVGFGETFGLVWQSLFLRLGGSVFATRVEFEVRLIRIRLFCGWRASQLRW